MFKMKLPKMARGMWWYKYRPLRWGFPLLGLVALVGLAYATLQKVQQLGQGAGESR